MTTATICTATSEVSTESKTSQANFTIEKSLKRDSVKIYVEDNVLYIENQSAKELGKVNIAITINDESFGNTSEKISGFSTYSLELTDYFSEDYINENNVNIVVDYSNIAVILICYVSLIAIIIIMLILFIIIF